MRLIVGLLVMILSTLSMAAAPQNGLWWNPTESGRGYAIDSQGSILVLTMFAYDDDGRMQWYYADGPLTSGGARWSGTLLKLDSGQPLNGAYRPATIIGNDGFISIDFSSRTTAVLTLPSGRTVAIQRQNFGVGTPPQALLGQWLFAYSIGSSTYGDRFNYTQVIGSTSTGNGVVTDNARRGAAEYQHSGTFAGRVVGFQFNSSGAAINQYLWTLMLEEGRGSWVSPITFNEYGMNVYKTATPTGILKALDKGNALVEGKPLAQEPAGISIEQLTARDPELGMIAQRLWDALQQATK